MENEELRMESGEAEMERKGAARLSNLCVLDVNYPDASLALRYTWFAWLSSPVLPNVPRRGK